MVAWKFGFDASSMPVLHQLHSRLPALLLYGDQGDQGSSKDLVVLSEPGALKKSQTPQNLGATKKTNENVVLSFQRSLFNHNF